MNSDVKSLLIYVDRTLTAAAEKCGGAIVGNNNNNDINNSYDNQTTSIITKMTTTTASSASTDNCSEQTWLDVAAKIKRMFSLWYGLMNGLYYYTVTMSLISTLIYAFVLYLLIQPRHKCNKQFPIILAITLADGISLLFTAISFIVLHSVTEVSMSGMCKAQLFIINVASCFTNWCWVMLWSQRYLAVFYPLLPFRVKTSYVKHLLIGIFIASVILELWTLVLMHEIVHDNIKECKLNTDLLPMDKLRWLLLFETLVSYMVPFILTVVANLGIILRIFSKDSSLRHFSTSATSTNNMQKKPSASALFLKTSTTQTEQESLNRITQTNGSCEPSINLSKHRFSNPLNPNPAVYELRRIVHKDAEVRNRKQRQRFLWKTILSASFDLALNFPHYLIHFLDSFFGYNLFAGDFRTVIIVEAVFYILYTLQYPLILLYVQILIRDIPFSSVFDRFRMSISESLASMVIHRGQHGNNGRSLGAGRSSLSKTPKNHQNSRFRNNNNNNRLSPDDNDGTSSYFSCMMMPPPKSPFQTPSTHRPYGDGGVNLFPTTTGNRSQNGGQRKSSSPSSYAFQRQNISSADIALIAAAGPKTRSRVEGRATKT